MRVIERTMFYGASPNTFDKARLLRNNMTEAETIMWDKLKNRSLFNARFRRQHPIGIFIVDFYCHEYKLAIEIDGEIHLKNEVIEYDDDLPPAPYRGFKKVPFRGFRGKKREKKLILRFTNNEVFTDLEKIIYEILNTIAVLKPPLGGRG